MTQWDTKSALIQFSKKMKNSKKLDPWTAPIKQLLVRLSLVYFGGFFNLVTSMEDVGGLKKGNFCSYLRNYNLNKNQDLFDTGFQTLITDWFLQGVKKF